VMRSNESLVLRASLECALAFAVTGWRRSEK
jgi:hypothetical protein